VTEPNVTVAKTSGGAIQAAYPHGPVIILFVENAGEMKTAWKKETALADKQSEADGHIYLVSPRNRAIVVATAIKNDEAAIDACLET
jgi:hypothetical protein